MTDVENDAFILEQMSVDDDSDDDFQYEEVPIDDIDDEDDDEDLQSALHHLQKKAEAADEEEQKKQGGVAGAGENHPDGPPRATVSRQPELVDDFIRNFFNRMGLQRSLETFQLEWYEMAQEGKLGVEDIGPVPDIYVRNQDLDDMVKRQKSELDEYKEVARRAQDTWDKLRKERDYHRMHHKRVVQEKNKLITDLKRLKKHYSLYEPALQELQKKYESAMKEKMLAKLERDRIGAKMDTLQSTVKQFESLKIGGTTSEQPDLASQAKKPPAKAASKPAAATTGTQKKSKSLNATGASGKNMNSRSYAAQDSLSSKGATLPASDRENPFAGVNFSPTPVEAFGPQKVIKAHDMTVSAMALHPRKPILATVSDDFTWKMWSLPNGELIMSGDGHKDWVADVAFHPKGTQLATASGDGSLKVWDFASASCAMTFTDHKQAVWSCDFHDTGDFVVTASLDHTAKLFDLQAQRCKITLRGHVDSVNFVACQPYTNHVCTGSGDKTVSIWDARTGLCVQTFYGHMNACNHVAFNLTGDTVVSTDADGIVKLWDIRMVQERTSFNIGPQPANKSAFDRSGQILAVSSDDCSCKVFNLESNRLVAELKGHEDAVQDCLFDPLGKYMVTCGSDATFRIWG